MEKIVFLVAYSIGLCDDLSGCLEMAVFGYAAIIAH